MKLRKWTSEEKMAIVLEGIKGQKSVAEICREHQISQTHSRHEPESVATLDRNQWPASIGIAGHFGPEYAIICLSS
jgi:transposase-like protein